MVDIARGLRDDLAAAIEHEEAIAATPETMEKPVEGDAPEIVETPAEPAGERPRGPDGKFLPKEAVEAAPSKPAEPAPKEIKKPDQPEAVTEPDPKAQAKPAVDPIAAATARWSAADKAMLTKLPPEAQQFLVRRNTEIEADYTKKTMAIAEFRKEYEPIDQMFQPFRQQMQAQGFTPATIVKAWAQVEQDLLAGKGAQIVAKLVQGYKIDPAEVAKAIGLNQTQPTNGTAHQTNGQAIQLDPDVDRLLQAHFAKLIEPIQKQVGEVVGFTQAQKDAFARQEAARQDQETRTANETVQSFIDAVDAKGQPLHPHYHEVERLMVTLAQGERAAGRKPDLEQIYDQAVYATPSTREKLLAAQSQAVQEANRQEARAKATAARSAAVSVSGAPTGGPAPKTKRPLNSIRDTIVDAVEQHDDTAA